MKSVVLSSAYLPPVAYFVCLKRAERVLIESDESYTKQTYRNRCIIAGPNGKQVLTVPVLHHDHGKIHIREVQIDYSSRWQNVHWRSIQAAYNKSPFFSYYREEFEPFFLARRKYLFDLNNDLLELCMKLARIKTELDFTAIFREHYDEGEDLRAAISPKNRVPLMDFPEYPQVFDQERGFLPDLSIIDLLFNRGQDTADYLESVL